MRAFAELFLLPPDNKSLAESSEILSSVRIKDRLAGCASDSLVALSFIP